MQTTREPTPNLPRYDTGLRWDSGVRWDGPAPQPIKKTMSQITTNIAGLTLSKKLEKGATIITKSTNNPLVPGNGPVLAEFSTAQAALDNTNAHVLALRETLRLAMLERDQAQTDWDNKLTTLANFTQTATNGDENAIISSGFAVRAANAPTQPVGVPVNLTVKTNGAPGVSKLRWKPVAGAVNYVIQCSPDPFTEGSWVQVDASTKSYVQIPGSVPGKACWFRVQAQGVLGDGPWSEPARRPVM